MNAFDVAGQTFGLLSVLLLAAPAYHLNRYAGLKSRLGKSKVRFEAAKLEQIRTDVLIELQTLQDAWSPWKAWCLHIGTVTAALACATPLLGPATWTLLSRI